ncbi:hypothetical protein ASZ90_003489 [hydrocarbon metagenome]|uniref:Uncharacterized protein n=1 Tax=hydrocarbon metagenome TaxID=938273 RepID=A0A0W8G0J1_9ZZZZ
MSLCDVKEFKYEDVSQHCSTIEDMEDQIKYLNCVLYEWNNNRPTLDPNGGMVPNFEERIKNDIEIREKLIGGEGTGRTKTTNSSKIVWLKNKQDLVFLYDKLIELEFIVEVYGKDKFLAEHFTFADEEIIPEKIKSLRKNLKNNYSNPSKAIDLIITKLEELNKDSGLKEE